MKKLLILAYDFPPYVSVGALRPYSWYQYLHQYGVYPVVITRQWSNKYGNLKDYVAPGFSETSVFEVNEHGTIIRTPYKPNLSNRLLLKYGEKKFILLRKTITAWYEILQWFFPIGPKMKLYYKAKKYLKKNKVDAIIATGDPFILFKYAAKLSKRFNIPWIADYRDPWTSGAGHQSLGIYKNLLAFDERKIVASAVAVVSVSDFFTKKIADVIKSRVFHVIPNGFNPEFVKEAAHIPQNGNTLSIGFAGTISKYYPIDDFAEIINELVYENPQMKLNVNFYGTNLNSYLQNLVEKKFPALKSVFFIHQKMSNPKVLRELASNNLLLLFNNHFVVGTKIYDYLALKRKILFCYEDDDNANQLKLRYFEYDGDEEVANPQQKLIAETNSGLIIQDRNHLKEVLKELYSTFSQNGHIECNSTDIEQYSREIQTARLAEIVKKITENNNTGESSEYTDAKEMRQAVYQQCTRCVMDTSDVDIAFDVHGYCNHCNNYFSNIRHRMYGGAQSEAEREFVLSNIKRAGIGKKYDCVIGVSGGVDSTYVAWLAKNEGLRPLLVHLDNGWNSEISVENIRKLAHLLDLDYECYVLDWEEFRRIQLSFLRASVPEMETPTDMAIPGALHKVAAKYGVKYIISGGNFATEGILPKTWHYNAKDTKYFRHILKKFGNVKASKFPVFGAMHETYYKLIKGIKIIYLLNYFPFNKDEAQAFLESKLGWKYYGGKHYESVYTGFVQSYIMPVKFNMDYRRATLSTQICAGEVERMKAIEILKEPSFSDDKAQKEKEYICKKLHISVDEFQHIMNSPPLLYRNYSNSEKRLRFIYNMYRRLYGKTDYR